MEDAHAADVSADTDSDDEVVTDDESGDEDEDRGDVGEDGSTFNSHRVQLSSIKVAELRRLLREHGHPELASVKAADLSPGVPQTGPRKSEAVRSLLCTRLAKVLTDEDEDKEA